MKNCIVLSVLLFAFGCLHVQAEEILLEPVAPIETSINLEAPDKEIMESSPQKLQNPGFILQNSITPVHGLKYDSQVIIPSTPKIKTNKNTQENK